MITAPEPTTQAWTTPLSSVAPTTTSSAPASTNLGHQRVRRVRVRGPGLRRAGLLAGAAGRPRSAGAAGRPSSPGTGGTTGTGDTPGTGGTPGVSLPLRRDRADIDPVQQLSGGATRPGSPSRLSGSEPVAGRPGIRAPAARGTRPHRHDRLDRHPVHAPVHRPGLGFQERHRHDGRGAPARARPPAGSRITGHVSGSSRGDGRRAGGGRAFALNRGAAGTGSAATTPESGMST
jgi:hypothetical protein